MVMSLLVTRAELNIKKGVWLISTEKRLHSHRRIISGKKQTQEKFLFFSPLNTRPGYKSKGNRMEKTA